MVSVKTLVCVNIHRSFVAPRFRFIKNPLPALQLTFNGNHRAGDCRTIQVGDGPHKVRQVNAPFRIFKRTSQTAALIINQDKGNFVRAVVDRHRQDIGDDEFRLAGACHSCDQAVRSLTFFVQIQHEQTTVGPNPDRGSQAAGRIALTPALEQVQVLDLADAEHFKKCKCLGQAETARHRFQLRIGQRSHTLMQHGKVALVQLEHLRRLVGMQQIETSMFRAVCSHLEHLGTLFRQFVKSGDHRKSNAFLLHQYVFQYFNAVVQTLAQGENHKMCLCFFAFLFLSVLLETILHFPP